MKNIYENLEKRLYTDKELKKLWNRKCKDFECFICSKKADLGYEIQLFPHCRNCYHDYCKLNIRGVA